MATINGTANDDLLNGTANADSITFSQGGKDTVNAGVGNDSIYAGASFDALDQINGGADYDLLDLAGNYAGGVDFQANTLAHVDEIHFGGGFSYKLKTHDATVGAGKVMKLDAYHLTAGQTLHFDGSAETNGSFLFYDGTSNDTVIGGAKSDTFGFGYGGSDQMIGGGGGDVFQGALDVTDTIDGGVGNDVLYLWDDYSSGLKFNDHMVQSIETVGLLGDFSYSLTTVDATVSAGKNMYVSGWGIEGANKMKFDGSAETDGTFSFTDSKNNDMIKGGQKNDVFVTSEGGSDILQGLDGDDTFDMDDALDANDVIFGGNGKDHLSLDGDYSAGLKFNLFTVLDIESISVAGGNDYKLATNDWTVAAGKKLVVSAGGLKAGETLDFDGTAEADGSFEFYGGKGHDTLRGGAGDDYFDANNGGNDKFYGGEGEDAVSFFNAYTVQDFADGGAGSDRMYLYGDFKNGLQFSAANVKNMESITLGSGFSYDVTVGDSLVAAGETIAFDTYYSAANESFTFNGASELDGHFQLTGGQGNDFLTGGAQSDTLNLNRGGNDTMNGGGGDDRIGASTDFTALDRINGGTGFDTVEFYGDFSAGRTLQAATLQNVERIEFFYGNDYKLTFNDGNLAAGKTLELNGVFLDAGESIIIDAASETDGRFKVVTGEGNDVIVTGAGHDQIETSVGADVVKGGAGNDSIEGGLGKDVLFGGAGDDRFYYGAVAESAPGAQKDIIKTWDAGDSFDFSAIDTSNASGDQGFAFLGGNAFSASGVAEVRFNSNGASTFVHADLDGNGSADLQIAIEGVHALNAGDFIL